MNAFSNIEQLQEVLGRRVRVYLAGPIGKNCWRHQLVPELREAFAEDERARARARFAVVTELSTCTAGFACVGPWFVSCDHGCAHGPGTHGTEGGGCLADGLGGQAHSDVYRTNIYRLRHADAVFAYFDRAEAYGSLFELGVAMERRVPIFMGFPPNAPWREGMWFSAQAGFGDHAGHVGTVEELWDEFCQSLDLELIRKNVS